MEKVQLRVLLREREEEAAEGSGQLQRDDSGQNTELSLELNSLFVNFMSRLKPTGTILVLLLTLQASL